MEDYLSELNEKQREAVLHKDGPIMIVAGAGSGKTKVLTTRIAHLMKLGVDAFEILALTFTNKAAAEMKERIGKILGTQEAKNLFIGTFHSVFARLLRTDAPKLGYPNNFTIYDADDSKSVIKGILKDFNLDAKIYKPNIVHNRISAAKNSLITAEEYLTDSDLQKEDSRGNHPRMGDIYKEYADRCFRNGAMDFDDLLFKMYELLTKFPECLAKYQHKFKYILIDEYQDTNTAQYKIIKYLAAAHENICVVGDDAQSIYSFRGATIENILRFRRDYPDTQIVKLEQNYRSTQNILQVANKVIAHNKNQIPKKLWTEKPSGEKIKLVRTMTDHDEGRFVADAISEQKLRNHFHNNDFAILYRTNAQSRSFEESLRRMNIPYRIFGGLSFYQRKEVKDFVAYLRAVMNPKDDEAIKRIINYPARGIGKTSMDHLSIVANQYQVPLWNVLLQPTKAGLSGAAANKINQFVLMIQSFRSLIPHKNAYELAFEIGKISGLVKELFSDKTTEGLQRYQNVQELLNGIKEFTEMPDENGEVQEDKSLAVYLQQITLLTDADQQKNKDEDVVKLMTIHAAKGLEFPCVFAVGLEENIFPSAMSLFDRKDLEEERRLFYVVVTRAREKLWISFAASRYRFGSLVQNDPSRFISEIPEENLDNTFGGLSGSRSKAHTGVANRFGYNKSSLSADRPAETGSNWKKIKENNEKQNQLHTHIPSENFEPSDPEDIEEGMKVEHKKFGFGKVVRIEGGAHNRIAAITFDKAGEKRIMLSYAKLMIIPN